ncbi:MAG: hypothetical protein H0V53_02430 [Rubrobacter sp.]|nr:hypothetical protein [Rubrobacter sp.]
MDERPEERSGDRRRGGPLGDEVNESEETRREPIEEQEETRVDDGEATRRIPYSGGGGSRGSERPGTRGYGGGEAETRETAGGTAGRGSTARGTDREEPRPRVIRTPQAAREERERTSGSAYPSIAEEREARLQEMYGGVDWLASFVGFTFTAVIGSLMALVSGLVLLGPLGLASALGEGSLGPELLTGLAVVAVVLFVAYFFGGYVSGRMARFDGGRNGMMVVVWTFLMAALLVLAGGIFGGLLPGTLFQTLRDSVLAAGGLAGLGSLGLGVAAGALLFALLGGFVGGRLGTRYHEDIDYTA